MAIRHQCRSYMSYLYRTSYDIGHGIYHLNGIFDLDQISNLLFLPLQRHSYFLTIQKNLSKFIYPHIILDNYI